MWYPVIRLLYQLVFAGRGSSNGKNLIFLDGLFTVTTAEILRLTIKKKWVHMQSWDERKLLWFLISSDKIIDTK